MSGVTPPRIYITSVEEDTVVEEVRPDETPTGIVPASYRRSQESEVEPVGREDAPNFVYSNPAVSIPSIDLAMSLDKQQTTYGGDGAVPLTSLVGDEWRPGRGPWPSEDPGPSIADGKSNGKSKFRCPVSLERSWPDSSQLVALLLVFGLLWAIAYSVLPPELSQPAGGFMRLMFLFVGAQTCGILVSLTGLPDMLGMLFWGVLYANVGWADFAGYGRLEVFLREMALVNIMLLAGLGLDYGALRSLFRFIMQLTLVPTAAEVAAVAVLARYLLHLPWLWGVLLGLVETAISPNVVVTVLLRLKEERLGLNKGIHTLIIAMTSCNDVLAIFLFGVILGVIFSTGDLTSQILQGPIGIVIGLVYGTVCGLALLNVPSYQAKYTNGLRFSMMALAGALAVVGSKMVGYPSAGALGCIVTAFVAGTGWRKRPPTERNEVSMYLDLLWKFLKPVSFSLIGKEVNFSVLAGETVLYGTVTLLVAVMLRLGFSYLSTLGSELNWKEKAYVTLAGFPKATVQAALGPAALDLARSLNATEEYEKAQTVLVVTVLAIILTAPLGALLMIKLAPRWLKRSEESSEPQYR